jgi:hypothetical protein
MMEVHVEIRVEDPDDDDTWVAAEEIEGVMPINNDPERYAMALGQAVDEVVERVRERALKQVRRISERIREEQE